MTSLRRRLKRGVASTGTRSLRGRRWLKQRLLPRAQCLFVAAMPKSGSTFLVKSLAQTTGYVEFFLGDHHLNAQDLYLPKLLDSWSLNVVCHQHTRATAPNLELMRQFRIRPVVLVRDVCDALVSLCDHLERESRRTPLLEVPESFLQLPRRERLDLVVDLAGPWYLSFCAGWDRAMRGGEVDALKIGYEELAEGPAAVVARVLAFHGLARPAVEVRAAVERAQGEAVRRNVGTAGRGRTELTAAQRQRVAALCRHFPDVEFPGLSPAPAEPATA